MRSEYPGIAAVPEWVKVGVCLGAIGGGTYDYIGYVGCLREKKWGAIGREIISGETDGESLPIDASEENLERGRRWLWPVRIDVGVGFLSVLVFTACFIILGAVVLHADHDVPNRFELLSRQARFLTDFHPALLHLYQVGIFMAFFGTIYGAYEIYIRTAYECLTPLSDKVRAMPLKTFRLRTLIYCASGGLSLIWFGGDDAMKIVAPAAIVGGVFTCGLWCFAMLWVDRRFLPRSLRMGRMLTSLNWVSGVVLTGLGAQAIWSFVTDQL